MIEIKQMCAGYGTKEVLHKIDMKFEPGKVTVLTGPNGCGKSTLLKSVVRLIPYTSGVILADGKQIEAYRPAELARKISYLSQGKNVPDISVLRMVLHGRFAYLSYPRRYRAEDIQIAEKALAWAELSELADENVSHLSGGMRQKVYIAMALAQETDTIFMDEPTTYLDVSHQMKVMDLAHQLAAQGKAVVMVLHDLSYALRTADYMYVMNEGSIAAQGEPQEIFECGVIQNIFHVDIERLQGKNDVYYVCSSKQQESFEK